MDEKMKFFMYLIENYADYKNRKTGDVFKEWERFGIISTIYDNYWLYHTEAMENAYADIDSLIQTGKHAW